MDKKQIIKKIFYSMAGMLVFIAAMLVLTHTAQNGVKTTEILPTINPDPVYVECGMGKERNVSITAKRDVHISGFQLLLVNLSEDSSGTLRIAVTDSNANLLMNETVPVASITPGKWITVSGDVSLLEKESYEISILADGSEPYFMQVPEGWGEALPFEETVWEDEEALPYGISLGILEVEPTKVTYGDIFYYSIPCCVILFLLFLLVIWLGKDKLLHLANRIPYRDWAVKYGNDIFLLLLFAVICCCIYSNAYLNGIYISADSTGYMREAVNLVNGNGFSYDELAGYHTWFANWPILYPLLIAGVMVITKTNAYLASKILTMLLVGVFLLIFRVAFRKDAWLYALCLTNIGFMELCYYTWSEIPFMVFLLLFGLGLARILKEREPAAKWYVLLGATGIGAFLTRYYGIYVWFVTGLYILLLVWQFGKKRERVYLRKACRLTLTAFLSGCLSMAYLLLNKRMNGMASGVSRTMWWDDYQVLTNDLIETLLTEFFNIFSISMPTWIENFPYSIKVFVVLIIVVGVSLFVFRNAKHFSRESVLITMAVMYEIIFIGIRYVSSMDTFYFRFFEPATFLLCVGILGLLLPYLKGKPGVRFFAGSVTVLLVLVVTSLFLNGGMNMKDCYYQAVTAQWDEAYAEIPQKSVIIFNDIDFRSSWYRPDVVDGTITPQDTLESIRSTYDGSDYLCIRVEFAKTMLDSGEYGQEVHRWLEEGVHAAGEKGTYVILPLSSN